MAFDATVGGSASTSLVSLADLTAYFESSLNSGKFDLWDEDRRKLLAMVATKQIGWYFEWIGIIASTTQSLPWPRKLHDFEFERDTYDNRNISNGYQLDTNPLDGQTIPQLLKDAVCELMLLLDVAAVDVSYSSIDELKVGPIEIKFGANVQAGGFSRQIIEMLKPIGTYTVRQTGGFQMIRLER